MTDSELIKAAKTGHAIITDADTAYILGRVTARVCAAYNLMQDAAESAFDGGSTLYGVFMDKPDRRAVALEWMELNYDSIRCACSAIEELLDDASAALADLPSVKPVERDYMRGGEGYVG